MYNVLRYQFNLVGSEMSMSLIAMLSITDMPITMPTFGVCRHVIIFCLLCDTFCLVSSY